jgi:hypothetical protein
LTIKAKLSVFSRQPDAAALTVHGPCRLFVPRAVLTFLTPIVSVLSVASCSIRGGDTSCAPFGAELTLILEKKRLLHHGSRFLARSAAMLKTQHAIE